MKIRQFALAAGVALCCASQSNPAWAQQTAKKNDWWFDIEVVLFKRLNDQDNLQEQFAKEFSGLESAQAEDLLQGYLAPPLDYYLAALPVCYAAPPPPIGQAQFAQLTKQVLAVPQSWLSAPLSDLVEQVSAASKARVESEESGLDAELPTDSDTETSQTTVEQTLSEAQRIEQALQNNQVVILSQLQESSTNSQAANPVENIPPEQSDPLVADQLDAQPEPIKREDYIDASIQQHFDWQAPADVWCRFAIEDQVLFAPHQAPWPETFYPEMPVLVNGLDKPQAAYAHLINQEQFTLTELYQQLKKRRGVHPMLHLAWRQPVVFGRNKAAFYRLYAGSNFAEQFASNGQPLPDEPVVNPDALLDLPETDHLPTVPLSLVEQIRVSLADPQAYPPPSQSSLIGQQQTEEDIEKVDQLWELDGLFKVYLQNIGRVPYLHIDSQLDLRQVKLSPATEEQQSEPQMHLQVYPMRQLRRVISKQIHYFDHPMFGMVVQIRRYRFPELPEQGQQ